MEEIINGSSMAVGMRRQDRNEDGGLRKGIQGLIGVFARGRGYELNEKKMRQGGR